jgi:hypothetical protein
MKEPTTAMAKTLPIAVPARRFNSGDIPMRAT